jgi:hypothetical protein
MSTTPTTKYLASRNAHAVAYSGEPLGLVKQRRTGWQVWGVGAAIRHGAIEIIDINFASKEAAAQALVDAYNNGVAK